MLEEAQGTQGTEAILQVGWDNECCNCKCSVRIYQTHIPHPVIPIINPCSAWSCTKYSQILCQGKNQDLHFCMESHTLNWILVSSIIFGGSKRSHTLLTFPFSLMPPVLSLPFF